MSGRSARAARGGRARAPRAATRDTVPRPRRSARVRRGTGPRPAAATAAAHRSTQTPRPAFPTPFYPAPIQHHVAARPNNNNLNVYNTSKISGSMHSSESMWKLLFNNNLIMTVMFIHAFDQVLKNSFIFKTSARRSRPQCDGANYGATVCCRGREILTENVS